MPIYWGDLHNHCGITYGFGSLENALQIAKTHLDFCSVTGHAMWPDMYARSPETAFIVDFHNRGFQKLRDHWEEVRALVAHYNSKDLVTFQGYEIHSSKYGDHHLISPDDSLPLIERESPAQLVRDCGCPAMAIPHHIGYTPGYRGINWDAFDPHISPLVEVVSKHGCGMSATAPFPYYHDMGPRDSRNTVVQGMKLGKPFSFVGSTDHHAGFPGSYGDGLTAVLAEEKTRESIWKALQEGRTYAVTGDRILCDYQINGSPIGSHLTADTRKITCDISAEDWIEKVVLYKNLKPIQVWNGEDLPCIPNSPSLSASANQRYKVRVELGWGNSDDLYRWDSTIQISNGKIVDKNLYFRGRSVLSPTNKEESRFDQINCIEDRIVSQDSSHIHWICETAKNKSTLHPQTDSIVVEIEGSPHTCVCFRVNGREESRTIAELLDNGFSRHEQPFHSQAYLVHPAIPSCAYQFQISIVDRGESKREDVYYLQISQKNGHYAFLSPIYVNCP